MFTKNDNTLHLADSISASRRGTCNALTGEQKRTFVNDSRVHDANFAFLSTELAKLHTKTYEPKVFFTYQDDVPVETGGGFVDYIEYFTVDWAGIMNDTRNAFGNGGNLIPRVNAAMTQNRVPVYTYEISYDLRFIELEKMKKLSLAKSLEQIYQEGIRAGFDYWCQHIAYLGTDSATGLFNSGAVQSASISNSSTTGKYFEGLSDDFVVSFFNGIFNTMLEGSNMNPNLLPDTILVPTGVMADLVSRFSPLYTSNLLQFILDHNLGKAQAGESFKLRIVGRPDLNAMGSSSKGRIVAYKKDKDFVRMDMPYPIQHYITLPSIERCAYTSVFVGQASAIQLPYNTSSSELGVVSYWDFTSGTVA